MYNRTSIFRLSCEFLISFAYPATSATTATSDEHCLSASPRPGYSIHKNHTSKRRYHSIPSNIFEPSLVGVPNVTITSPLTSTLNLWSTELWCPTLSHHLLLSLRSAVWTVPQRCLFPQGTRASCRFPPKEVGEYCAIC